MKYIRIKRIRSAQIKILIFILGMLFLFIHRPAFAADELDLEKTFKFRELGNDVWLSLRKNVSARVGFRELGSESLDDSRDSMRSFSPFSALLNWHLFEGNFYLSMGAVQAEDPDLNPVSEYDVPRSMSLFSWSSRNQVSDQPLNFDMNKNEPYLGFGFANYLNKRLDSFFFLDFGILHYSVIKNQSSESSSPSENMSFFEKLESISLSDSEKDNTSSFHPLFKMGLSLKY